MSVRSDNGVGWLRWQRELSDLENEWMALRFDLDGAVAAEQVGLIWHTRGSLVTTAAELFLRRARIPLESWVDGSARVCVVLNALSSLHPALGERLWTEVLAAVPAELPDVLSATEATVATLHAELGAPLGRDDSVRVWAESVQLLRHVAQSMGIAQSDDWYLPGEHTTGAGWYGEVIAQLSGGAAGSR